MSLDKVQKEIRNLNGKFKRLVYITGVAFPIEFYWRYQYLNYPPTGSSDSKFFKYSSNIKSEPIFRRNDYIIPLFREDKDFYSDFISS